MFAILSSFNTEYAPETGRSIQTESSNKKYLLEDIYNSKYYFKSILYINSIKPDFFTDEYYKLILMYQYYTNEKLPRISVSNDKNNGKVRWKDIKPFIEGLHKILKNSEVIKILQINDPHFKHCYDEYQNSEKNKKDYERYLKYNMPNNNTNFMVWTDRHSISGMPSKSIKTKRPRFFRNINEPIELTFYSMSSSRSSSIASSKNSSRSLGWLSEVKKIKSAEEYKFLTFCNNIFKNLK